MITPRDPVIRSAGSSPFSHIGASTPDWFEDAACVTTDPDAFFPEVGEGATIGRRAKAICAECPVRVQCLDYALANNERYGIWGGLTEHDRKRLRREQTDAAGVRVCRLAECEVPLPVGAKGSQKFCTVAHAKLHSDRAYVARKRGVA